MEFELVHAPCATLLASLYATFALCSNHQFSFLMDQLNTCVSGTLKAIDVCCLVQVARWRRLMHRVQVVKQARVQNVAAKQAVSCTWT